MVGNGTMNGNYWNMGPIDNGSYTTQSYWRNPTNNCNDMSMPKVNIGQPVNTQTPAVYGRFIQDENEILAKEIPMDGSFAAFVKMDLSTIFLRTWGGDGDVHGDTYVKLNNTVNQNEQQDPFAMIFNRLAGIESMIGSLLTPPSSEETQTLSIEGETVATVKESSQNQKQMKGGKQDA